MIRLGVIGCGGHAIQSHIETAAQAGFVLYAVFDPKPEQVAKAIAASGSNVVVDFDSAEALITSGMIDALVITSLVEFHADQLTLAVAHGIPVLVDKLLATDPIQMERVKYALNLAQHTGVIVTSCHPRRFDPPYMWVVANLPRLVERLGELIGIELDFSYHIPSADWKHTRSLQLDHFPHEIDWLRRLMGECEITAWKLLDEFDQYCVVGQINGEVSFMCSGTRMLEREAYPEEIRLRFARGSYTVNTESGVGMLHDHAWQAYQYEIAGKTDHTLRAQGVMNDFRRMLDGEPGALTLADLEANTGIAVALADHGFYP